MGRRQFIRLVQSDAGLAPFTNAVRTADSEASIKTMAEIESHKALQAFMALGSRQTAIHSIRDSPRWI